MRAMRCGTESPARPRIDYLHRHLREIPRVSRNQYKIVLDCRGSQQAVDSWKRALCICQETSPAIGYRGVDGQDAPHEESGQRRLQPVDQLQPPFAVGDGLDTLPHFAERQHAEVEGGRRARVPRRIPLIRVSCATTRTGLSALSTAETA